MMKSRLMNAVWCLVLAALGLSSARAAEFDIRDAKEFGALVPAGASVKKIAGDFKFIEGPIWIPKKKGMLLFSDIPADEIKQWTAAGGISTFRHPSHNANGNTLDKLGQLVTCEHSGRRVSLTEKDGIVSTIAEYYQSKRLNSPNDVVVKSDGSIWFTDPDYGISAALRELGFNGVYRFDTRTDQLTLITKEFDKPNGLAFSPDERRLYIADSGKPHHIRAFDVSKAGAISNDRVFCVIDKGGPDGIRCDAKGHLFSSAGDGVHIFSTDGKLIGKILVPESPANLCFGGKDRRTLFITARTGLYSIDLSVKGAK